MTDDRRYEGEYPGREGLPFGAGGRSPAGPDEDLFVWSDLRSPDRRRDERRRPSEPESRDWRAPEYPTGAGRTRYEPADGFEASEEWEEWLEPETPHGSETIGPLPERHAGPRRRRSTAGAVLLAMLFGFFFAGLLDVGNIKKDVEARPYGALRTVQLALLSPMSALSGAVRADRLGAAVADALGRGAQPHHSLAEVKAAKPLWPRTITSEEAAAALRRRRLRGPGVRLVARQSRRGDGAGARQERLQGLERAQPARLLRLAAASHRRDRRLQAGRGRRPVRRQRRPGRHVPGQGPQGRHQGVAGRVRAARGRGDGHPHQGRPPRLLGGQSDHA